MLKSSTVAEEILEWKTKRGAAVLAHYYQDPEIQEIADQVGDCLELCYFAQKFEGETIVFCGSKFMAETAKVLNPAKKVILPDLAAGCSLVDSCPVEGVRAFRRRHPDTVIVCHINTSVEVKAESDILCTSRNAMAVVRSIPARRPVLFVPDLNLGTYVKEQTGRKNMQVWQGACIVHATFAARRLMAARAEHLGALVAAHPECAPHLLRMADYVGSSAAIVDWCARQAATEFIVLTDSGLRYVLERRAPGKKFYFINSEGCNCSECPYTRVNTLEKVLGSLQRLEPRIEIGAELIERARVPIERMLGGFG